MFARWAEPQELQQAFDLQDSSTAAPSTRAWKTSEGKLLVYGTSKSRVNMKLCGRRAALAQVMLGRAVSYPTLASMMSDHASAGGRLLFIHVARWHGYASENVDKGCLHV